MRLITIFELAAKSETELRALFRKASEELIQTSQVPDEQVNASKSLANIAKAIRRRNEPKP